MSQPERKIELVRPGKPAQPKNLLNAKVELEKIRRELLTLASRVDKLIQSQETA